MSKKFVSLVLFTTAWVLLSQAVQAKPITTTASTPDCAITDMKLDFIRVLDGVDSGTTLASPFNADACYGLHAGNNSGMDVPTVNRGYLNDGWFNQTSSFWPGQPGAFIDNNDLQDLQGAGAIDPGWVYMGKDDGAGFIGAVIPDFSDPYTFVNDLFTCSVDDGVSYTGCTGISKGRWKFTPPSTQPEKLLALLGGTFFDRVAVVFKGATGFLAYSFSISNLGLDPILAGETKYEFAGSFDLTGKLVNNGGKTADISNVSLWARDPFAPRAVAEPASAFSVVMLASLLLFRFKRCR